MDMLAFVVAAAIVAHTSAYVAEVVARLRGRARHRRLARRCHQLELELEDARRQLVKFHMFAFPVRAAGSTPPVLGRECGHLDIDEQLRLGRGR